MSLYDNIESDREYVKKMIQERRRAVKTRRRKSKKHKSAKADSQTPSLGLGVDREVTGVYVQRHRGKGEVMRLS